MIKVLHFSPVRKDPKTLHLHLKSLECLNDDEIEMHYSFFDDNVNRESSDLLQDFIRERENAILLYFNLDELEIYLDLNMILTGSLYDS